MTGVLVPNVFGRKTEDGGAQPTKKARTAEGLPWTTDRTQSGRGYKMKFLRERRSDAGDFASFCLRLLLSLYLFFFYTYTLLFHSLEAPSIVLRNGITYLYNSLVRLRCLSTSASAAPAFAYPVPFLQSCCCF